MINQSEGQRIGTQPDLARTWFEIGKCLFAPKSATRQLNGITAEEYLEKARGLFEEMELQYITTIRQH